MDNGDRTILDRSTGLIWQQCSLGQNTSLPGCSGSGTNYVFYDAETACQNSNLANRQWRLPSFRELFTLLHFGSHSPAINQPLFPNTHTAAYWTSTKTQSLNHYHAFAIQFIAGGTISIEIIQPFPQHKARCVSGLASSNRSHFQDNHDGTITDLLTGLIWEKCLKRVVRILLPNRFLPNLYLDKCAFRLP